VAAPGNLLFAEGIEAGIAAADGDNREITGGGEEGLAFVISCRGIAFDIDDSSLGIAVEELAIVLRVGLADDPSTSVGTCSTEYGLEVSFTTVVVRGGGLRFLRIPPSEPEDPTD
jgi:hypothetical protein